nr:hypothetical protein [Nitrosomonas nitrosa]
MANIADTAITATLAALAAMLREGLGKVEQARRLAESGDPNSAFSRLIEADRFLSETASLRQAAMMLLRNNAVLATLPCNAVPRAPAQMEPAARA